jgi:hypothetical protein
MARPRYLRPNQRTFEPMVTVDYPLRNRPLSSGIVFVGGITVSRQFAGRRFLAEFADMETVRIDKNHGYNLYWIWIEPLLDRQVSRILWECQRPARHSLYCTIAPHPTWADEFELSEIELHCQAELNRLHLGDWKTASDKSTIMTSHLIAFE